MPQTATAASADEEASSSRVDDLIQRGRSQGHLSLSDLRTAFERAGLQPAEARSILRELSEAGVRLADEETTDPKPAPRGKAKPAAKSPAAKATAAKAAEGTAKKTRAKKADEAAPAAGTAAKAETTGGSDPEIAEDAFRNHPEMLLTQSDISVFVANWNDKAENLKAIATRLNIGLDSLVFVDDNPAERARVRQSLPMVAVPELPKDVAHYVRCLADAGYFEAVAFTREDRHRTEQYAANAERESLFKLSASLDDFLKSLQMSVAYGPFTAPDLGRVTQLFNKTNQFNTTTKRYSAEEIAHFAAAEETLTLQFRLLDKYGDNGLVSAMILRPDSDHAGIFEIDNWVMSCRVFGRELEFEAMNIAVEYARRRGSAAIRAAYIPTSKNGVIKELYSSLGFTALNDRLVRDGDTCWFLDLAKYVVRSTHISQLAEAR